MEKHSSQFELEFGNRLRTLRKAQHLSQAEVAAQIGLCRSAYSYYEAGRAQPGLQGLATLAHIYGVTADYLLGMDEPCHENLR